VSRLTTPDDQVGIDYVIGCKNAKYRVPTLELVDAELSNVSGRLRRWTESDKFPDLVETLTEDRDRLLDRRMYLMMLPPAADMGTAPDTDRGLVR